MTKPVKQLEKDLHRKICSYFKSQGYEIIKLTTLAYYGRKGWPDIIVLDKAPRHPLWIEIKSKTGRVTWLQQSKILELRERGYQAFVVRSMNQAKHAEKQWRK